MLEQHKRGSTDDPRVSVITIFLNGESFLAEAIESVIAQTFSNWEYLLVDDGSGPAATAIAKEYAARYPEQIRYLEHPNHINRGMSATRNLGIRHARGEFIAFLDADDVWLPSKLAEHVALLDEHQGVGMVTGTTVWWHSWSAGEDRAVLTGHRQDVVIYPPEPALALYPLGEALPPSTSDIVLRTSLLRQLGGFEDQFTGFYEDEVVFLKIYLSAQVYFSSEKSIKYRMHPESCVALTKKAGKYHEGRLLFLEWLEQYLKTRDKVDPRVLSSLRRALRPYRSPRIHYLLSLSTKARNRLKVGTRFRHLINRAGHLIQRQAS